MNGILGTDLYNGSTPSRLAIGMLKRQAERVVLQDAQGRWTGRATLDCIAAIQFALVRAGCVAGSRIAVLAGNRPETWCAGVAAQALGLNITWLHPLGALSAHVHQIEDFEPGVVIIDSARYPDFAHALCASFSDRVRFLSFGSSEIGEDLLDRAAAGSRSVIDVTVPSQIAQVNYTGGTTGRAKGAWRTNAALAASAVGVLADFELPRQPSYLAIGPISHVTGAKILPTLLRGGRVVMVDHYDPGLVCETIDRERIDTTLLVPTMIYGLLDSPAIEQHDLSSLELILYGALPMSATRLEQGLARLGPVFAQLYGQTECYPIAVLPREDHDPSDPARLSACGYASNSCWIELLDGDSKPVPEGEAGEICVRSPYAMGGYWKQPELTAATLAQGWLHTGDVGRFDEDGRLYIVDRIKDLIISGGFNVYPREVEDALAAIPGVAMAAVFGVPDPKWGEAVVATVVATPGAVLEPSAIIAATKIACGSHQAPKQVRVMDALPLTAAGKIDKKQLKAGWSHERSETR
jgi:fatty-acyl-CoA synthase